MTISSALTALNTDIDNARTAITNKGGTITVNGGSSQLAADIATIPTGGGGGGIGIPREVVNGVFQMPTPSFTFSLPSGVTDLGYRALHYAFTGCTGLVGVDFSNLTYANGQQCCSRAFEKCTNLTTVDLSGLVSIGDTSYEGFTYAFDGCTSLTSVDLSSLQRLGSSALNGTFRNCTSLTSVSFPSLEFINGGSGLSSTFSGCTSLVSVDLSSLISVSGGSGMRSTFADCTNLTNISFPNLEIIGRTDYGYDGSHFASCFYNCSNITSIAFPKLKEIYCNGIDFAYNGTFYNNNYIQKMYFPKLDTITYGAGASTSYQEACKYIFNNCPVLTELHFGAANQAAIEATAGYPTAWGRGAGNVTIYFDL